MSSRRDGKYPALAADIALSLLAPSLALMLAIVIHSTLGVNRLGLLFLAAVTIAASIRGSRAALMAALVGLFCYKSFLDLRTGEQTSTLEDLINLAIFVVVALITGALAGRVHDEAERSRRHAKKMGLLFKVSRALSTENESDLWSGITDAITRAHGCSALAMDSAGIVRARSGNLHDEDAAAALGKEVLARPIVLEEPEHDRQWRAHAIVADGTVEGVLVWQSSEPSVESDDFVEIIVDLASATLARARMRQEQIKIRSTEEAGRLREALLSSISHDFRSPLAAIIGSSTSLLEYGDKFDEAVRRDLLLNIQDEGEKLNQFVANLLDMTKLQSGVITASKRLVDLSQVLKSINERLDRHRGKPALIYGDTNCVVEADPLLLSQALYNILDNAVKYADPSKGVEIACITAEHSSTIIIADHGPGLPIEDRAGVFTTFHYARKTGRSQGTGLGLSISRGFVEAMGGTIEARDRSDGLSGLEIAITLPRSSS
jgi:two-component system sensor histidine kinase KdpD